MSSVPLGSCSKSCMVTLKCSSLTTDLLIHLLKHLVPVFRNKTAIIHSSAPLGPCSSVTSPHDITAELHNLTLITEDEVQHLVLTAPCESCDFNPIPTSSVYSRIDILATTMTSIVNLSLKDPSLSTVGTAHVSLHFENLRLTR